MKHYIEELGNMALASRLKQITDLLMRDMVRVYNDLDIPFEPRWFTFVYLLSTEKKLSLTQIARKLNQTHPAANQVANILDKNKLIENIKDKNDQRKRMLRLTRKGQALVNQLEPIWQAVQQAVDELFTETGFNLLDKITTVENHLDKRSMNDRIKTKIRDSVSREVNIINYKPVHKHAFIDLNLAWLEKYFKLEPHDHKLLFNPDEEIIGKNGDILIAIYNEEIVGTAALLKINSTLCELTKMSVRQNFQGRGIGRKILKSMVILASNKGYKKMVLLTSPKLTHAVKLYRSFGFTDSQEISLLLNNLERDSIQMEIHL